MKKTLMLLAVILAFGAVHGQDLVYYWNFNSNAPGTDQSWAQPIASAIGTGQITYTFTEAYSFTGTTINGTDGESNGGSFAPRGGVEQVNNGAYFTITASTAGYDNIILTYPTRRTSTGFTTQEIKYTVNGTDWISKEIVDISAFLNNWVADQLVTVDFTGVASVANNPNFAIRIVLDGSTSDVGNNRFDNIRITAASQGAVATPTFNPPGGVFTQPVNVTISTTTPGATIRYTTNGSTPNENSTLYTAPISVSANTTIKAIAYASGLDPSNVATAVFMFPVVVQNMTQLREQTPGDGTVYRIAGEVYVSFQQSFRHQKMVQDDFAGVLIVDTAGIITTNYNLMDGITGLTGTILDYNNMLEFIPVMDPGPATSTNNSVIIPVVTAAMINNSPLEYQARLVRINNAHFVETGAFASGTNYTLQDGSGSVVFRTYAYDADYIGEPIPSGNINIYCLVNQYNTTAQVFSRMLADWAPVANDDETSVPVTTQLLGNHPNPFNPGTTISYFTAKAEPVQIVIYNQKGQAVKTFAAQTEGKGTHSLQWDGTDNNGNALASGIYFYKMLAGKYSSTGKMVLMK